MERCPGSPLLTAPHLGIGRLLVETQYHRPPPGGPRAICHGDFHPQNVLAARGEVTAVLDWPNVLVADPAYDVAATRVLAGRFTALTGVQPQLPARGAAISQ